MTHKMNGLQRNNHYTPQHNQCHDLMPLVCETGSDAIIIYDSVGRVQSVNRAAEALFGYDEEDVVARPINFLLPDVTLATSEHDYLTQMTTAQTADGQSVHVELMLTNFYSDCETYSFAIVRDMSTQAQWSDHSLSPRQRQVLKLVVRGYTSREIAEQLIISVKTVETHRANIMTKLGVRNVSSLVRYAIEQNII